MESVLCYCENHCPGDQINGTCEAGRGAQCYSAVEEYYNKDTSEWEIQRTWGCLPPDDGGFFMVSSSLHQVFDEAYLINTQFCYLHESHNYEFSFSTIYFLFELKGVLREFILATPATPVKLHHAELLGRNLHC